MAKPWGGIGAWAAEAERAEAEEEELAASSACSAFPSLVEAVSKPKKKKQTFSISEFNVGFPVAPGNRSRSVFDSRGLTPEEMMMLPRGPRDRSGEEEQFGGLGGAFRDYRADAGRFDRERDRGGFGAGYERERESGDFRRDRERDRDEPSRADGDSNWGASKKPLSSLGGRGYDDDRRGARGYEEDRRGGRTSDRDAPWRADEVDNWGSSKKMLPPAPLDRPGRYGERREAFDESRHSRADETDNWAMSKRVPVASGHDSSYRDSGADADRWSRRDPPREESQRRPRLLLAPRTRPLSISPPSVPRNDAELTSQPPSSVGISDSLPPPPPKPKPNPFGSARPREEILAEKGQDWRRIDTDYAIKERDSRPSSSHSSRADTLEISTEVAVKPKPKVNPFGNARPREVLLEEKGKDWRKMEFELEHRGQKQTRS